ncbi:MAG TPA: TatD family hydrolase [Patescibacteria group bacterium]|nr:TatD family hydrolase [Patescibacteria group bacterium]
MIFDTHVHYNLEPFFPSWKDYWIEAQQVGVGKSMVVGTDLQTSKAAVDIAEQDQNLFAAVGIHPSEEHSEEKIPNLVQQLQVLLNTSKKVIALGECGLDYFHVSKEQPVRDQTIALQKTLFEQQILLAKKHNLALIIHCRNAYDDMLSFLKAHKPERFVLHCMSGTSEYLHQAINLGGYISFAGNITYPNAESLRNLVLETPKDRLLVETDAPFLSPQQWRGKPNHPSYIKSTVQTLADVHHFSYEDCERITTENAERFFRC